MSIDMNKLLEICMQQNASDIHITVGRPPSFRISGSVKSLNVPALTADDTAVLMKQITPERGQQEIAEIGSTDFAIGFLDKARFRVNVFKQKGRLAMVLRLIPSKILTFEQIGLPPHIKDLCTRPRGLILVTGPTGSGKSTTLATMVDFINSARVAGLSREEAIVQAGMQRFRPIMMTALTTVGGMIPLAFSTPTVTSPAAKVSRLP